MVEKIELAGEQSNIINQGGNGNENLSLPPISKLPPVRLSMFDPNSGSKELFDAGYLEEFAGPMTGRAYLKAQERQVSDEKKLPIKLRIDNNFAQAIMRRFNQPTEEAALREYRRSMQIANEAIGYFINKLYPGKANLLGLHNEVDAISNSPADMLEVLSGNNVDPRLKFEMQRAVTLALLAPDVTSRLHNKDVENELVSIQQLMGKHLYEGPIGYTPTMRTFAQHDPETNDVLWVEGVDSPYTRRNTKDIVWKMYEQKMRPVEGVGHVLTNLRYKEDSAALLKAARKAAYRRMDKGDDSITPLTDVTDLSGMIFVVKSPNNHLGEKVNVLMNRVTDILGRHNGHNITDIEQDDFVNGDPHQSPIEWKRLQLHLRTAKDPIELIFMTEPQNIRYRQDVGHYDPTQGEYTGRAHSLFVLARLNELQGDLFPKEIYYPGKQDADLKEVAKQTMHKEAQRLKNENVVLPRRSDIYQV